LKILNLYGKEKQVFLRGRAKYMFVEDQAKAIERSQLELILDRVKPPVKYEIDKEKITSNTVVPKILPETPRNKIDFAEFQNDRPSTQSKTDVAVNGLLEKTPLAEDNGKIFPDSLREKLKTDIEQKEFDPHFYLELYDGLKSKIETVEEAYRHWLQIGRSEGRVASEAAFYRELGIDQDHLPKDFDYQNYLYLNPDVREVYGDNRYRAISHFVQRGWQEQREYNIRSASAQYKLGYLLSKQGKTEAAIDAYRQAIALQPNLKIAYQKLGQLLQQQEETSSSQTLSQNKSTHILTAGSTVYLGDVIDIAGNFIIGWMANQENPTIPATVSLVIDGIEVNNTKANLSRNNLGNFIQGRNDRCWFKLQIPDAYLDGRQYNLQVLAPDGSSIGGREDYTFQLKGYLDLLTLDRVAGWIFADRSKLPLELDLYINGTKVQSFFASLQRSDVTEQPYCGFDLLFDRALYQNFTIALTLKNSEYAVLDTPKNIISPVGAVSVLQKIARAVKDRAIDLNEAESQWVTQQLLPKTIDGFRSVVREGRQLTLNYDALQINRPLPQVEDVEPIVDVIVPVYKNYAVTKLCIESVLKSVNRTPINLVVIDDRGPEPELSQYLKQMADAGKFELVVNPENKGFVQSVNCGMSLHPNRDVVLLNADAIVSDYWLDRLRSIAHSHANIASVTPISNHASIFSYPRMAEEVGHLPADVSRQELDTICQQVNLDTIVDVPTNHGFCCFLRRAALTQVGLFDAVKWGKGYGEEVDWSLKSARLGWRHVATLGVFVEHVGSQSFSDTKDVAISRSQVKLAQEYPDFDAIVQDFLKLDPLAKYRRRIDIERLKQFCDRYILFIAHGFGGGTQRHIEDLSTKLKGERLPVLCLTPEGNGWVKITCVDGIDIHARYNLQDNSEVAALISELKTINVIHLHIHSTIDFVEEERLWQLATGLGIQYDVTLHDYQYICPRVSLSQPDGKYCGEPTPEACDLCILKHGTYDNPTLQQRFDRFGSVAAWRDYYGEKLQQARQIIVPSHDVRQRILKYFPNLPVLIKPHPEELRQVTLASRNNLNSRENYRVALIGGISVIKGYDLLYQCALYALNFGYPLEFVIFGYTKDDPTLEELANVKIIGSFDDFMGLEVALLGYPCDISAFLSVWPETYSYTLSEALTLGLLPLGLNIGAIGERISKMPNGVVVDPDSSPKQIVERLLELAKFSKQNQVQQRIFDENQYPNMLRDYYELTI
jgi:GT2 family glycosyltransferase/glycosyltransferase involved in cell wall biosynthesis/tetratricopeptide (TPR) repeat protein